MSKYFNYFPKTIYNLSESLSSADTVTNIMSKYSFEPSFKNNTVIYYEYVVTDGETPEMLAHKLYGSVEKHWIILSLNDIVNPMTDWPMNERSLIKFIDKKYSTSEYANSTTEYAGIAYAQSHNYLYYKILTQTNQQTGEKFKTKLEVDADAYALITPSTTNYTLDDGNRITIDISKESKTYYEYEIELNDGKRKIKILKPEFASVVERELIGIFNR